MIQRTNAKTRRNEISAEKYSRVLKKEFQQ